MFKNYVKFLKYVNKNTLHCYKQGTAANVFMEGGGGLNSWSEAEFLEEIQTKIFRVFLLAIHSHLYSFALRLLFFQTHAISYVFLQ